MIVTLPSFRALIFCASVLTVSLEIKDVVTATKQITTMISSTRCDVTVHDGLLESLVGNFIVGSG